MNYTVCNLHPSKKADLKTSTLLGNAVCSVPVLSTKYDCSGWAWGTKSLLPLLGRQRGASSES